MNSAPRHVLGLALGDVAGTRALLLVAARLAHQREGVSHRGERVAQLVREDGEELVLAALRLDARGDVSREMLEAPMIRPLRSRSGEAVSDTGMRRPVL